MRQSKLLLTVCAVLATAAVCYAGKSFFFNPQGAVATGPANPSTVLSIAPDVCCGPGITASASTTIAGSDWQAIRIPLNGLASASKVKGVKVTYQVETASPGTTGIDIIRITTDQTNQMSTVAIDDSVSLTSTAPATHTTSIPAPFLKVDGPVVMYLRVFFGSASDKIHVGRIEVF